VPGRKNFYPAKAAILHSSVILSAATSSHREEVAESKGPLPFHKGQCDGLREKMEVSGEVGVFRLHLPIRKANGKLSAQDDK
jgi:hypothetical protein